MGAVEVLDHQFAAIILLRFGQKQRDRQVGPDPQAGQTISPHRVVDMDAEMMPVGGRVAVEQRRKDLQRDRRRDESRVRGQRREHAIAERARDLAVRRQVARSA